MKRHPVKREKLKNQNIKIFSRNEPFATKYEIDRLEFRFQGLFVCTSDSVFRKQKLIVSSSLDAPSRNQSFHSDGLNIRRFVKRTLIGKNIELGHSTR